MFKFLADLFSKKSGPTVTVDVGGDVIDLPVEDAASVLEVLTKNGIEIPHSCGGMGTCGTCRIDVLAAPPAWTARNEVEEEFATERAFKDSERLACQSLPCAGLKIRIQETQSK